MQQQVGQGRKILTPTRSKNSNDVLDTKSEVLGMHACMLYLYYPIPKLGEPLPNCKLEWRLGRNKMTGWESLFLVRCLTWDRF